MDIASAGPRLDRYLQSYVLDHCEKLARTSELSFVVSFAVISILLSALAEFGLSQAGLGAYELPPLLTRGAALMFLITIVLAPLLETLLLQQMPITLAKRFGMSRGMQFLAGCVPFAVVHFNAGLASGIAAGVVGGSTLSLAYLTFIPQSKSKAFVITTAIHALHNFAPAVMITRELP